MRGEGGGKREENILPEAVVVSAYAVCDVVVVVDVCVVVCVCVVVGG